MKQTDIKKCAICKEGMMKCGIPTFYTVTIQRHMIDLAACQRQTGLEMQLGGHAQLANIMGPDDDISKPVSKKADVWICQDCANDMIPLISLDELQESSDG